MNRLVIIVLLVLFSALLVVSGRLAPEKAGDEFANQGRKEVLFWHFWGGADRDVVEQVVKQFNESQSEHYVRAIAMPGNNLQAKLFLAIAGGDPPDLVNQDDPIIGDWAARGAIQSIESIANEGVADEFDRHLFSSAKKLGTYNGQLFGVCNGLDIRALYFNRTALQKHGLGPPTSIENLNQIAKTICPPGTNDPKAFGYLPDSRRLWAWGYVFGGDFYDNETGQVLLIEPHVKAATKWMAQYASWYGADTINRFRQGDQSLPGKTFPLLPIEDDQMTGRYAVLMDGQWRVRDINAFVDRRRQQGIDSPEFGVCPLPTTDDGRSDAGWVNGNFFVVPKGAKNPEGAIEFMKYWIGMKDAEMAAQTCAAGGWIPVAQSVVDAEAFQTFLKQQPLFAEFVRIAGSENQFPVPIIPGAPMLKREVEKAAAAAMNKPDQSIEELLQNAQQQIQKRLDTINRSANTNEKTGQGRQP